MGVGYGGGLHAAEATRYTAASTRYADDMRRPGLLMIPIALLTACGSARDERFEFVIETPPCSTGEAQESRITAIGLELGTEYWSEQVPFVGDFDARLVLDGDRIVFPYRSVAENHSTGEIEFTGGIATLATSGQPMWQPGVGYVDSFGVVDGTVVAGAIHVPLSGEELGIQVNDGVIAWRHLSDHQHLFLLDRQSALFEADNRLISRDPASGEELWAFVADGISDRGAVALQGRAVVAVSEGGWYADLDLSSGEYIEIRTATGGSADRVVAVTTTAIVGYETSETTSAKGRPISKEAYVAYDRTTGDTIWQHDLQNAYAPAWAGSYVIKPGQTIQVIELATGADAARIPVNEMSDFRFVATREHDILIGHGGRITILGDRDMRTVHLGGSVRGAWQVDAVGTLVASTRADGVHLVTMMDEQLESVLWSLEFEQPVQDVLVAEGAAYILASNSSCSTL